MPTSTDNAPIKYLHLLQGMNIECYKSKNRGGQIPLNELHPKIEKGRHIELDIIGRINKIGILVEITNQKKGNSEKIKKFISNSEFFINSTSDWSKKLSYFSEVPPNAVEGFSEIQKWKLVYFGESEELIRDKIVAKNYSIPISNCELILVNLYAMNLSERNAKIIDLYFNQCKTYREIAKITHTSPKQIKKIIDDEKQKRLHDDAIKMIFEGKTMKEIIIALNLDSEQIERIWKQYLHYHIMDSLHQIYLNVKESPIKFLNLCYYLSQKNLKTSDIEKLIQIDQELDYNLNLRDDLVAEVHGLKNTIYSQKQQILDQKRTIQNNTDKINQLKIEEKQLEWKLTKIKKELTITTTKINAMKSGKTYHDFQQQLFKKLNDDQKLSNLIYSLLKVIIDNLYPFALYDKEWTMKQIPNLLEMGFEPVDNLEELLELDTGFVSLSSDGTPSLNRTVGIIVEKCKETIMNLFLEQYSLRS